MTAITQYSRIQHRRGLTTDLPNPLQTSEFGHCLDSRRIFIGNGTPTEGSPVAGNTELITDYTLLSNPSAIKYVYKSNTPIIPVTGPTESTPIVLGIGQILDDYISIKRYGAKGDGITDDTVAINRALRDLFTAEMPVPYAKEMAYRKLYFPAGTYIVSDYVYTPPNANLDGDGNNKTIIKMIDTNKNSIIKTVDSLFQNDVNLGNNSAILPTNISINGILFQHEGDHHVVSLDRASNVSFTNCGFLGNWTGAGSNSCSVYLNKLGGIYEHSNIQFHNCTFAFTRYLLKIDDQSEAASRINFDYCTINSMEYGLTGSLTNIYSNFKFTNNNFKNITFSAIHAGPKALAIISNNNTFDDCGSSSIGVVDFATDSGFFATDCSSIGDKFLNCGPIQVRNSSTTCIVLNNGNTDSQFKNVINQETKTVTLLAAQTNVSTTIVFPLLNFNTVFVDYTVIRGSARRVGRLYINTDGTTPNTIVGDDFIESAVTGITFDAVIASGNIQINYTSTSGSSATFATQAKGWRV